MLCRRAEIREVVGALRFSAWGFADLSGLHPLAERFPTALSLALAYEDLPAAHERDLLRDLFEQQRNRMTGMLESLSVALREAGLPHMTLDADYDHALLLGPLSHKLAARQAGLGWIGRSSLLVSPKLGPRLRLATVLLPAMPVDEAPVRRSRCGPCRACVVACPHGAISGRPWHPRLNRGDLLDVHLCRRERAARPTTNGGSDPCARCMLACPIGRGAAEKSSAAAG